MTKGLLTLGHVWGAPTAARDDLERAKGYRSILRKGITSSSNLPDGLRKFIEWKRETHVEYRKNVCALLEGIR